MIFSEFLQLTEQLKTIPLGGLEAQFKLAPELRLRFDNSKIKARNPKRAAVLALFYPNTANETMLLLTKRASYNGAHSSQISFPGGKIEESDTSLSATAIRETYEEVGIQTNDIQIIREITDVYIPPSNFLATPFIANINYTPSFTTNEEVERIIEVPVTELLNDKNIGKTVMKTSYMDKVSVPCFVFDEHTVWGATGMMLSEIREMIIR